MPSKPTRTSGRKVNAEIAVTRSSGNVFADLGCADAETMLAKADLAIRIAAIISARRLTQRQAAGILGIDQPGVSDLILGHLRGYSTERLIRFLNALGQDVELVITDRAPSSRRAGRLRVSRAAAPAVADRARRPRSTPARGGTLC
jgi:predicted XRE-type DNA-binding protein